MKNSNILVVEDDFAIRSLITTALETENYKYHVAKNGNQAIMEAATQAPELILLDLGLPDIDGVDVIRKIRTWSTVPITVISARSEDKDKIDALDAGADDYITKPFSTAELLARIRGNYRRIQYIQNNQQGGTSVFHNGSLTIDYQMQTVYVKEEEIHVTPIEYKILCLLAKNLGRVLTHTHITKEIWGSSLEGDIASLRVHVAKPKNKGAGSVSSFNFFKEKIVCADCGKTMYLRGRVDGNKFFECGNYTLNKKCFSHSVKDIDVNDYVLRVIRTHINVYTENVDMVCRLNQRQESIQKYDVFNREIRKCRRELEKLAKHREQLFEDYVCKLIDAEQYEVFAAQDTETEKEIQNNLDNLLKHKVGYEKNFHTEEDWEKIIDKYRNTRTLTKDMIDAFVEKIEISSGGAITVHLVYDDMLEELRRYAKERKAEICR